MIIRTAVETDAAAMSEMLQELVAAGKRKSAADVDFVLSRYLTDPERIRCSLAEGEGGQLLGFQSLKRAGEGNPYGTPVGWGIIGTHVSPSAARQGVGSGLFAVSVTAAREAGLQNIEAFISADNGEGLAYYDKMGFRTYRFAEGAVCKRFDLAASS